MWVVFTTHQGWPSCFLSIPYIHSTMVITIFVGRSLNKMFPLNFCSKKYVWTILVLSKSMFWILLLQRNALIISLKQWMTVLLEDFKPPQSRREGELIGDGFEDLRTSIDNGLRKQLYAWIEQIIKLKKGEWLKINVGTTWFGYFKVGGLIGL